MGGQPASPNHPLAAAETPQNWAGQNTNSFNRWAETCCVVLMVFAPAGLPHLQTFNSNPEAIQQRHKHNVLGERLQASAGTAGTCVVCCGLACTLYVLLVQSCNPTRCQQRGCACLSQREPELLNYNHSSAHTRKSRVAAAEQQLSSPPNAVCAVSPAWQPTPPVKQTRAVRPFCFYTEQARPSLAWDAAGAEQCAVLYHI